ncbi:MAG: heavy metal-associated domain-containing protein [Nitrospirota bacterium]
MRAFIKVPGLTEDRAADLARALAAVEGVVDAEVFAEDEVASVLYDVRADVSTLMAVIKQAGYDDAQPL